MKPKLKTIRVVVSHLLPWKKLKELKAQALALMPQFLHQVFEFLAKKDNANVDAASTSVENLQLQSLELRALDEVTQSALEDKVAAFLRSKQGDAFAYLRKAFSVYASRSEKITAGVIGGVLLLGALAIVMMMGVVLALTIAMTPNLSSIIMGTLLPIIVILVSVSRSTQPISKVRLCSKPQPPASVPW